MCLEFTLGSTWYLWPDYTRTWLRSRDHYGHPWEIFVRRIMEILFLVISFHVGVPILRISIFFFLLSLRCTGHVLCFSLFLLFSVIERCFLGYSLHQFWISWKRPADFRAHQPGPLIIHSDAVHEVHVDTSIYGVINFLRLLKPWKAWKVRGCINKSSQTHLKSFSTPLLATAGLE